MLWLPGSMDGNVISLVTMRYLFVLLFDRTGNMERIMKSQAYSRAGDSSTRWNQTCWQHLIWSFVIISYYLNQKKTLEINPRHPLMKELLRRVEGHQCLLSLTSHDVMWSCYRMIIKIRQLWILLGWCLTRLCYDLGMIWRYDKQLVEVLYIFAAQAFHSVHTSLVATVR